MDKRAYVQFLTNTGSGYSPSPAPTAAAIATNRTTGLTASASTGTVVSYPKGVYSVAVLSVDLVANDYHVVFSTTDANAAQKDIAGAWQDYAEAANVVSQAGHLPGEVGGPVGLGTGTGQLNVTAGSVVLASPGQLTQLLLGLLWGDMTVTSADTYVAGVYQQTYDPTTAMPQYMLNGGACVLRWDVPTAHWVIADNTGILYVGYVGGTPWGGGASYYGQGARTGQSASVAQTNQTLTMAPHGVMVAAADTDGYGVMRAVDYVAPDNASAAAAKTAAQAAQTNTGPAGYLEGEIAAVAGTLAVVKAKTDTIVSGQVSVVSPVSPDGRQIRLRRGDSYGAGAAPLNPVVSWTDVDGTNWPDLTNAAATFYAVHRSGTEFRHDAVVAVPAGAGKRIDLTLTAAETRTLIAGDDARSYSWAVRAVLAGGLTVTLRAGFLSVADDLSDPQHAEAVA